MSVEDQTLRIDSSIIDLEAKARQAYEQHRVRECLRMVKKLLVVYPDNSTAAELHAIINNDIDRTLSEVRALIEERQVGSPQARLCAAEVMLKQVLQIDPDHSDATSLLERTQALAQNLQPIWEEEAAAKEEAPFTAGYEAKSQKKEDTNRSLKPVLLVALSILAIGGVLLGRQLLYRPAQLVTVPVQPVAVPPPPVASEAAVPQPTSQPEPETKPIAEKPAAVAAATAPEAVKTQPEAVPPVARNGTLAISSPIAADIYEGEQLLGSTPATLQLSAGSHTLEFRHANLRKTVTQVVKADETTAAVVTFDVVVQINAKPWAQVFLDGSERQALGQTPLSGVKVPIGRTIVFENPQFPPKSYRVTGKETAIQIVFP